MKLFAACLFVVVPCSAISIATVDVDWKVTEIATSTVLCSGSATSAFDATVCAGAIPGWDGIALFASVQADAALPHLFSTAQSRAMINFLDPDVADDFDITAHVRTESLATQLVVANGGTGNVLIVPTGSSGAGGTIGTGFGASANIAGLDCFFGCSTSFSAAVGAPFLMHSASFADVEANNNIGILMAAEGAADVGVTAILNLDGTLRSGTTLQLVPEPSFTWIIGFAIPLWACRKFRNASIAQRVTVTAPGRILADKVSGIGG